MNMATGGLGVESVRRAHRGSDAVKDEGGRISNGRIPGGLIPGSVFTVIITLSAVLVFGLMARHGLALVANAASMVLAGAMLTCAVLRYALRDATTRVTAALRDFAEYCLLFMAISLLGVVSTYPLSAISSGFSDDALIRMDTLMGFDWVRWYGVVVRHPALQELGSIAYSTIYVSPAIILIAMAWQGEHAAARRFLLTFWLAAFTTLSLFPFMPANGPLVALWTGAIPYMPPTTGLHQSELIPVLREHLFTQVDMGALRGLVCAPSFHTVCGVLYIATAWQMPRLRWPLLAMNVAMLLATPVEGNHYLSDMMLGLAVALTAILIVRRITRPLNDISLRSTKAFAAPLHARVAG